MKRPEQKQIATIVSPEMFEELARLAERNDRSIAAELRLAIRAHMDAHDGKVPA
jgi:hypothetical protein